MEQYRVPNKLPSEEINILAQRKGRLKQQAKRSAPPARKVRKPRDFVKATIYVAQQRRAVQDAKRIKRNFLKTGFCLPNKAITEGRLVLVFRHRGLHIANKDVLQSLRTLRLPVLRSAAFHLLTPEIHAHLKVVEPFVVWGYPADAIIRELIYKYGAFRGDGPDKKSVPMSSNQVVEQRLGHCDIICVEDLLNEVITLGPHFDEVRRALRCFILSHPVGGWKEAPKGKLRSIGGEAGFRGDEINVLFKRLL
ncbi:large ribosomal subunit protein uL30-like [Anopheles bellator]|uniref:large ribosomal subunit protein uL30-like n=1 Tax=Anopheles bellator TaxID=139047 RepID=UPI002649FE8B|nr:large ribosomal subunit protein uL30-like [Anopheles bellator]